MLERGEAWIKAEYREIFKLAGMLVEAGIPFNANAYFNGFQVAYPCLDDQHECICSVIEMDNSDGHEQDLLEIWGLLTSEESKDGSETVGGLTADEVFRRINEDWKRRIK